MLALASTSMAPERSNARDQLRGETGAHLARPLSGRCGAEPRQQGACPADPSAASHCSAAPRYFEAEQATRSARTLALCGVRGKSQNASAVPKSEESWGSSFIMSPLN